MKVRVTFTVDINPESWDAAFGISGGALREDVKGYAERLAVESLNDQGLLTKGF